MTSSQRTHPSLEAIHHASRRARQAVDKLADPKKSREELCRALDEPQRDLAWDILNYTKKDDESPPPVVWVNSYVRLSKKELPDAFSKERPTQDLYIYRHTALSEGEDAFVQEVEDAIERNINEEGATSLTLLLNDEEEWRGILNERGNRDRGLIEFYCDPQTEDLHIETEDSALEKAFAKKAEDLSWYAEEVFRGSWKNGRYLHISRPNFAHLPIDEAGVYMMVRQEGGVGLEDLLLFQIAYRSFLFEITTARIWGIAQELDEQRRKNFKNLQRTYGELQDEYSKTDQQRRELQRQESIFAKIEEPLNKLTERLTQAQQPLHEIQAALSPVEGFLFQGDAISRYFDRDRSVDFNDQFTITTEHDYFSGEPEKFKERIAAILLTALQQSEENIASSSLWEYFQHIFSNPSESGRELTLETDALRAVLPELLDKDPRPSDIERIFNSIKHWFCYGFEPGRDFYASFIHLALHMLIDNPLENVDLERNDLRNCNLKACSERPVDSIRALDKLNGAYGFNSAACARENSKIVLKITHDAQEQREEDLRDAKENLDIAQRVGGAGSSGNYEFTTTLHKLFGTCPTQEVHVEEDEAGEEWLILRSTDQCSHDTSLLLKRGPQSCETKITWKEAGGL